MFNVGGGELLVILLIALIVLGPQRLPDAARTVGRVMGDLRRMSSGFQQELKDAFDDSDSRPVGGRPRKESVPLAASVAAVDEGTDTGPGDGDERDDAGTGGGDEATTVAPAVAAAIDEIVTPLPGGDDLGDERAAS
jgi:Tat protein translocase TatB subunit